MELTWLDGYLINSPHCDSNPSQYGVEFCNRLLRERYETRGGTFNIFSHIIISHYLFVTLQKLQTLYVSTKNNKRN